MNYKPEKFKVGNKINMLTIISVSDDLKYVKVKCDCGNEIIMKRAYFGFRKSCGCRKHAMGYQNISWKENKTEIYRNQWNGILKNARARNLEFNISIEDAYEIYLKQGGLCALSEIPLEFKSRFSTASLDRINSDLGYTKENVQWVHRDINKIKMDLPSSYFEHLCNLISNKSQHLNYEDVLIKPHSSSVNSRKDVEVVKDLTIRGQNIKTTGIICSNMYSIGTFQMAKVFAKSNSIVALHKFYSYEYYLKEKDFLQNYKDNYFFTIGQKEEDLLLFKKVNENITKIKMLCVDVANGYRIGFINFLKRIREQYPDLIIMAGNVSTGGGVYDLHQAGVDIVKIQIGPGSECETRLKTGIGTGTITSILECSNIAKRMGVLIATDGGIRCPGDVAKSFVANSDFVMIGGMFAGTDEQDGEVITRRYKTNEIDEKGNEIIEEKKFKTFYGMSSLYAQEKHFGEKKEYRTSEGRVEEVPYIGPVQNVIDDILGGLRSCGTYIGAKSIKNFGKCGTFIRCNRQHDRF